MKHAHEIADQGRFAALDGLRGLVAVSVLFFHIGHWIGVPFLATNSGLAVDFFFCLSGFVLTHAYATRLDHELRFQAFMELRLRRLMPLLVLGTLISAAYVTLRAAVKHEPISALDIWTATALGALNIPYFDAPPALGGPQIFPLNGPQYTLFLEVFVNAFWAAATIVRGPRFALSIALAALITIAAPGVFGGDVAASFWMGFPRVLGTFYLGVLAYYAERHGLLAWLRKPAVFWSGVALTLLMFYAPLQAPFWLNIVWIALVAPVLVFSGAAVPLTGRVRRLALRLGVLSYPLYILHYPVFCWINGSYQYATGKADALVESLVLLFAVVPLAFAADRYIDRPVRRLLAASAATRTRPELVRHS